jgi:activator of 2-hydroxyglutaryl-CoA dehydratase
MAKSLGFPLEGFGVEAARAGKDLTISSMCTVFAESEVTSLVARGEDRNEIALGLHKSIVRRAVGMLKRVHAGGPVVFSGGVARNACICDLIRESLNQEILVAEDPQWAGTIGAALIAADGAVN